MSAADWLTPGLCWTLFRDNYDIVRDFFVAVGAVVGLVLLFVRTKATYRLSDAALQQAETASMRHTQQTEADTQRRITESFARAIEQLGSEQLEVRLGGIHTLARIALESPADHWPIMETLTAFVREKARLPYPNDKAVEALKEKEQETGRTPPDVQAALTAIGRRCLEHDPDGQRLDLNGTNLSRANLENAHLEKANLSGAFLMSALLARAHLDDAYLSGAHLDGAVLQFAQATRASLEGAHLDGAHLRGAVLDTVIFRLATLSNANLVEADLRGAIGLTQEQLNQAYGDPATTKLPEGMNRAKKVMVSKSSSGAGPPPSRPLRTTGHPTRAGNFHAARDRYPRSGFAHRRHFIRAPAELGLGNPKRISTRAIVRLVGQRACLGAPKVPGSSSAFNASREFGKPTSAATPAKAAVIV
jgi:hypothetical protein